MMETHIADWCNGKVRASVVERASSMEYILREWNRAKQPLFDLFGQDLILSKEIIYEKDMNILRKEVRELRYHEFYRLVNELRWSGILPASMHHWLFDAECLATNKYLGGNSQYSTPKGDTIQVKCNTKLMKVLARIAKEFNFEEQFEDFRLKHSLILNDKKLKGKLCLSIHPLDFMTMSDNECDWRSCMSWRNTGEYAQGTVEMMNSTMVVIAYLESEKPMKIGEYEWNNKKWRELFVVNEDLISEIKSYPYSNKNLTTTCLDWIKSLMVNNKYDDELTTICPEEDEWYDCIRFITNFMYNDFQYEHLAYLGENFDNKEYDEIYYSGKSECMICGELNIDCYDNESLIVCEDCYSPHKCDYCGCHIPNYEGTFWVDDMEVCNYCYEAYAVEDIVSEELRMENNTQFCHIYDSETGTFYQLYNKIPCEYPQDFIRKYYNIGTNPVYYEIKDLAHGYSWQSPRVAFELTSVSLECYEKIFGRCFDNYAEVEKELLDYSRISKEVTVKMII